MPDLTTFWELLPEYGVAPPHITGPDGLPIDNPDAGSLEPLAAAPEFTIVVVSKQGDQFVSKPKKVKTRLVDGNPRAISTDNPQLEGPIVETGLFRQIDPPTKPAKKES